MTLNPFDDLFMKSRDEAYKYFDKNIRRLSRRADGTIDPDAPSLNDNDVDAFRHAYVSGVFTQSYGEKTANILGLLNEFDPAGSFSNFASPRSRIMDLWNNRVGRKYGKSTRGRKTLLKLIHKALKRGELIVDLKDPREFAGKIKPPKQLAKPIVALTKSGSGRNETYYDLMKKTVMSREEFVALIHAGEYPGYSVKLIRGAETPVSKRDGRRINNIG